MSPVSKQIINNMRNSLKDLEREIKNLEGLIKTMKGTIKKGSKFISKTESLLSKGLAGPDMLQQNKHLNMEFLALQNQMQGEMRQYNALSNIIKVRHDSANSAIQNVR